MSTLEVLSVATFLAAMGAGAVNEPPHIRNDGARVSLGVTQSKWMKETVLEVGIEWNKWELAAAQQGNSRNNTAEGVTELYSLTRVVRPDWNLSGNDWQNYYRIGPAYVANSPFVGNTNMRLGVGMEWRGIFALEWSHYSSANLHDPNFGVDITSIKYHISF